MPSNAAKATTAPATCPIVPTNGERVKGSKPITLHQQKQNPEGPIIELP